MYQKSYVFIFVFSAAFYFLLSVVSGAHAQQVSLPNITPYWIKRVPYTTAAGLILSKSKASSSPIDSLFSPKNLLTTIPGSVGGLSILAGSLFAWWRVRKKGKTFKSYLQKIELAEQTYQKNKGKTKESAQKALRDFKKTLTDFQNDIDLAAANKKIDEEQRTTLFHDLDRKLAQAG